jgi:hypothetical protein
MAQDHSKRLRRNAASKATAINDGQEWSAEELDWLNSWDGTPEYLEELAELLGRTIEACRERFYKARRGQVTRTTRTTTVTRTTTTEVYRGWMEGDDPGWD